MDFELYKHHIYFIILFLVTGIILQLIIQKIILSLYPDHKRNSVRKINNPLSFYFIIGRLFSWTVPLYLGCKIYYVKLLPDELFSFLIVIIKIEAAILIMLFLSHGINHILKNIAMSINTSSEGKYPPTGEFKKSTNMPVINAVSWVIAFIPSTLVLNVIDFSSLLNLLIFFSILLFALVLMYNYSEEGHQLLTGFIGCFYLKAEQKNRDTGNPFKLLLEDGQLHEVKKISLFHTSFKTETENIMIRNNSILMILNYGFKKYKDKPAKYP